MPRLVCRLFSLERRESVCHMRVLLPREERSLSQNLRPAKNQYLISYKLLVTFSTGKGYEHRSLFFHLSPRWHLQYMCKWVAKRREHGIINIQLYRAATNDIFAALSVFWVGACREGREDCQYIIILVKGWGGLLRSCLERLKKIHGLVACRAVADSAGLWPVGNVKRRRLHGMAISETGSQSTTTSSCYPPPISPPYRLPCMAMCSRCAWCRRHRGSSNW